MADYRLGRYRGKWAVIWLEQGQTRRASLNAPVSTVFYEQADILFKQWVARESVNPTAGSVTVGAVLDAYFEAKEGEVIYRTHLVSFFRSYMPEAVNQALVDKYVEHRIGRSASTHNAEIGILKTALRWAKNNKVMACEVPYFQVPTAAPPREVWKTKEEIAKLIESTTTPHVRLAMLLMRYTGARSGAILSLPWDRVTKTHIDYNDLTRPRTRKKRAFVPLSTKSCYPPWRKPAGAL
jgi:hypothetical protein